MGNQARSLMQLVKLMQVPKAPPAQGQASHSCSKAQTAHTDGQV
jgi:hypothetical protein